MADLTPMEIRLHALNLAAAQRREILRVRPNRDEGAEADDQGWLARETIHDAQLYADWLAGNPDDAAEPLEADHA